MSGLLDFLKLGGQGAQGASPDLVLGDQNFGAAKPLPTMNQGFLANLQNPATLSQGGGALRDAPDAGPGSNPGQDQLQRMLELMRQHQAANTQMLR